VKFIQSEIIQKVGHLGMKIRFLTYGLLFFFVSIQELPNILDEYMCPIKVDP